MAQENPRRYGIYFSDYGVNVWKQIAEKSHIRDHEYACSIAQYFNSGTILELGGACGQFVEIFRDMGFDVTGSDYSDFFVDYQRKCGYKALKIDATDIAASIGTPFDNIYAQGLSPLMERSEGDARNRMTYASMHAVLRPKGRVIMVQSAYRTSKSGRKLYLSLREQLAIVDSMKLFQVVKVFNHMIIPPGFYSYYNRRILNWIDFNIGGVIPFRHIIILEKI